MTLLSVLATLFGVVSGFGNIPQAYRIFRRRSASDISIITYLIFFMGAIVWIIYGFEINNAPLIITNFIGAISIGIVIVGWILYGRSKM